MSEVPPKTEWPDWVAGVIETKVKERVGPLQASIEEYKTAVTTRDETIRGLTTKAGEYDTLASELNGLKQTHARAAAFRGVGLDAADEDVEDGQVGEHQARRDSIVTLYEAAILGVDDAPDLNTWLGTDARAHPLVAAWLPREQTEEEAAAAAAVVAAGGVAAPASTQTRQPVSVRAPVQPGRLKQSDVIAEHRRLMHTGDREAATAYYKEHVKPLMSSS